VVVCAGTTKRWKQETKTAATYREAGARCCFKLLQRELRFWACVFVVFSRPPGRELDFVLRQWRGSSSGFRVLPAGADDPCRISKLRWYLWRWPRQWSGLGNPLGAWEARCQKIGKSPQRRGSALRKRVRGGGFFGDAAVVTGSSKPVFAAHVNEVVRCVGGVKRIRPTV
jgi:hypothetical protein